MDEPEAALSVHGQLQFLVRMRDLVAAGCRFVIATHSALLMAYPNASIFEFTDHGLALAEWANVDTVRITSDFLALPSEFLNDLLNDDLDE